MYQMKKEAGFSYIDVMAAMVILLVGILALLSAITASVIQSKGQELQISAKQIAASSMESIISVKETDSQRLGWAKLGNVGSNTDDDGNPQGIFLVGFQPVRLDPGPDQILGTEDDTGDTVVGFQRRIVITDQCDPDRPSPNCNPPGDWRVKVRSVEVTVSYYVGSTRREERITTVLTNY